MTSIVENFGPTAATMGGGFFVGLLLGYALKKVIKILAVIVGLFLSGLAYLQYHQIANINWNKRQTVSEGALLHESDISQLSLKNSNQMIDMTSELFIVDPETT
jgi:uncharacterized membrane protein (Fun14 family)